MSSPATALKYEMPSRSDDPTWDRMEDQIGWYDRKSLRYQKTYKRIKVVEIIAAAAIPFLSALNISQGSASQSGHLISWTIGGLGLLITILEGVLQLNQYQQNWIAYRSACEGLKHEKFAYLAKAAPYNSADPHALLAERVEALISQEHAKWASVQQQVNIKTGGDPNPSTT
jgi:hypothetical protein